MAEACATALLVSIPRPVWPIRSTRTRTVRTVLSLCRSIVIQTDGKILVGGYFESIGGQLRRNIARLDPATGLADSFDPNANNNVFTITVQADGKILVGGFFTTIGGQARVRHRAARCRYRFR